MAAGAGWGLHGGQGLVAGLVLSYPFVVGVGLFGFLGDASVPGRPTTYLSMSPVVTLSVAVLCVGASAVFLLFRGAGFLGFAGVAGVLGGLLVFAGVVGGSGLLLWVGGGLVAGVAFFYALVLGVAWVLVAVLGFVAGLLVLLGSPVGWLLVNGASYAGVVGGFAASVLILLQCLGGRCGGLGGWRSRGGLAGLLLVVAGVSVVLASVAYPHVRWGWGVAFAVDTLLNLRDCSVLWERGLWEGLLWRQRPLYTGLVCPLARVVGEKLFFDVVVVGVGLVLLVVVVYRLSGGGLAGGLAGLLSALYWAPFFVFAGIQTNLLALPAGLALAAVGLECASRGGRRCFYVLAVLSLFLGLWHPWTLAYYGVSLVMGVPWSRVGLVRGVGVVASSLLPGLAAHGVVWALGGRSGVAMVLVSAVAERIVGPAWGLDYFFWGLAKRGVVLAASVAGLALAVLGGRGLVPGWAVYASLPALLGAPLVRGDLVPRLLVEAPLGVLAAAAVLSAPPRLRAAAGLGLVLGAGAVWWSILARGVPAELLLGGGGG